KWGCAPPSGSSRIRKRHPTQPGGGMTPQARIQAEADQLEARWRDDARWHGLERTYTATDVVRLRGSVVPEHTLARLGAERLWELLRRDQPVRALGALTGGQAVQMVKAGLEAIDDRGRRRRRALRGPARLGEEVRAPRRQGPRSDPAVRAHAERGAAGGGRARRTDRAGRPHRCAVGGAAHE